MPNPLWDLALVSFSMAVVPAGDEGVKGVAGRPCITCGMVKGAPAGWGLLGAENDGGAGEKKDLAG